METYEIFLLLQAYVPSKKHKNNKDVTSITQTKTNIDTVDKEGKSSKISDKEANTSPISEKRRLTQ